MSKSLFSFTSTSLGAKPTCWVLSPQSTFVVPIPPQPWTRVFGVPPKLQISTTCRASRSLQGFSTPNNFTSNQTSTFLDLDNHHATFSSNGSSIIFKEPNFLIAASTCLLPYIAKFYLHALPSHHQYCPLKPCALLSCTALWVSIGWDCPRSAKFGATISSHTKIS